MHHTTRLIVVLALVCAHSSVFAGPADQSNAPPQKPAAAQATPDGATRPRPPRPKANSDNRLESLTGFTVDYPKKDWQPLFGTGSSLVVLFHKNRDMTVAIERTTVLNALTASEITDRTAALEYEDWALRRPLAAGFGHQFVDYEGERTIVIDFTQPGPRGTERVRIYTLPRGQEWFRVICTTTPAAYDKYKDTCHKIGMSLTPAPSQ